MASIDVDFDFFIRKIMPIVLCLLSILCNYFVITIYSRDAFKKQPSKNFLRLLAISNLTTLPQIVFIYMFQWGYNISSVSSLICKLIRFSYYIVWSNSAWIIVYISVERYTFITTATKIFAKFRVQAISACAILGFNMILYFPFLIFYDVSYTNSTIG